MTIFFLLRAVSSLSLTIFFMAIDHNFMAKGSAGSGCNSVSECIYVHLSFQGHYGWNADAGRCVSFQFSSLKQDGGEYEWMIWIINHHGKHKVRILSPKLTYLKKEIEIQYDWICTSSKILWKFRCRWWKVELSIIIIICGMSLYWN